MRLGLALLALAFLAACDAGPGAPSPGVGPNDPPAGTYFDNPSWHPGGRFIAAKHVDSLDTDGDGRNDTQFNGVWLIDAITGETQPLLPGTGAPRWSPDGRRLAVHSGAQIYSIDVTSLSPARVDTASVRRLTSEGRNFFPAWSPDGARVAYDNTNCGGPTEPVPANSCGVLTVSESGTELRFLTARSRFPDWSPSGNRLIAMGYPENDETYNAAEDGGEILSVELATGAVTRLTFNDRYDDYPRYSPDGRRIGSVSQSKNGTAAVWVMNADGSGGRQVSPDGGRQFDWSPDGRRIVFLYLSDYCYNCGEPEPVGNGELWIMNADGSSLRRLTHFRPSEGTSM